MKPPTTRKFRGPEVWSKVRAAYLAGEPAPSVCRRFDVGLANLRRRAATEGWTRAEASQRDEVGAVVPVLTAVDRPTYYVTPRAAMARAAERTAWLLAEGRSAEATALMKAIRELEELIERFMIDRDASVLRVHSQRDGR